MMIEPPIEKLCEKTGNKYVLTNLIAIRAKQIQKRNFTNQVNPVVKEITEAANEIIDGKLTFSTDETAE